MIRISRWARPSIPSLNSIGLPSSSIKSKPDTSDISLWILPSITSSVLLEDSSNCSLVKTMLPSSVALPFSSRMYSLAPVPSSITTTSPVLLAVGSLGGSFTGGSVGSTGGSVDGSVVFFT